MRGYIAATSHHVCHGFFIYSIMCAYLLRHVKKRPRIDVGCSTDHVDPRGNMNMRRNRYTFLGFENFGVIPYAGTHGSRRRYALRRRGPRRSPPSVGVAGGENYGFFPSRYVKKTMKMWVVLSHFWPIRWSTVVCSSMNMIKHGYIFVPQIYKCLHSACRADHYMWQTDPSPPPLFFSAFGEISALLAN